MVTIDPNDDSGTLRVVSRDRVSNFPRINQQARWHRRDRVGRLSAKLPGKCLLIG